MDLSFTYDALKEFWDDTCTVYAYTRHRDTVSKLMVSDLNPIITEEPCRVSFGTASNAEPAGDGRTAELKQEVKLFTRAVIPEGSVVDITRRGVVERYRCSSPPKLYDSHREYVLTLDDRRA